MPLHDLVPRFRELGRLRTGHLVDAGDGKTRPAKLGTWRLTSPAQALVEAAATLYGGEAREWTGAPGEGKQFEVITDTDTLAVVLPPGTPLSQSWELWSGGGCERRCDGQRQVSGQPCACPADLEQRRIAGSRGKACKPTSRLTVMLPELDDLGVWRLESHGYNAAVELGGTAGVLSAALAHGRMVPARLRLEQRTAVNDGKTHHFAVPVLEVVANLGAVLEALGLVDGASPLGTGAGAPALDRGPGAPALEAGAAPPPAHAPDEVATATPAGDGDRWKAAITDAGRASNLNEVDLRIVLERCGIEHRRPVDTDTAQRTIALLRRFARGTATFNAQRQVVDAETGEVLLP